MPFYVVKTIGDDPVPGSVIHPYPTASHQVPLFVIPDICGNGMAFSDVLSQLRELDCYKIELGLPIQAQDIKSKKIYLYISDETNQLEYAVKVSDNEIKKTTISPNDENIDLYYDDILAEVNNSNITSLSPEYETAIYSITTEQGYYPPNSRPIFVYYDSIIAPTNKRPLKECQTIQDQAAQIVQCMIKECLPTGGAPYIIATFSFGCEVALEVAALLKQKGLRAKILLIDGVAPEILQTYFLTRSESLTLDIIKMIEYLVRLSPSEHTKQVALLEPNADLLAELILLPPLDEEEKLGSINTIAKLLKEKNNHLDTIKFGHYLTLVTQNIRQIINYDTSKTTKIKNITALLTSETIAKHGKPDGGWDDHCEHYVGLEDTTLQSQTHMALLNKDNSAAMARHIADFIDRNTQKDIHERTIKYISFHKTQHALIAPTSRITQLITPPVRATTPPLTIRGDTSPASVTSSPGNNSPDTSIAPTSRITQLITPPVQVTTPPLAVPTAAVRGNTSPASVTSSPEDKGEDKGNVRSFNQSCNFFSSSSTPISTSNSATSSRNSSSENRAHSP